MKCSYCDIIEGSTVYIDKSGAYHLADSHLLSWAKAVGYKTLTVSLRSPSVNLHLCPRCLGLHLRETKLYRRNIAPSDIPHIMYASLDKHPVKCIELRTALQRMIAQEYSFNLSGQTINNIILLTLKHIYNESK
jgi:hypothetical protein